MGLRHRDNVDLDQAYRDASLVALGIRPTCSFSQFKPIMQHNFPLQQPLSDAKNTFAPKSRQGARDRFNRRPEIIRYVTTPHWKDYHARLLKAAVYFQQKGGNFLQRVLAAQEKKVVFRALKSSGDQFPHVVGGRNVIFHEAPALSDPERSIDDRLGRKPMNFSVLDTEDIARQMKRADLPPTAVKALVSPYCALPYLVHIIRRLCFAKNLRAL
jgi:hypothetical protein